LGNSYYYLHEELRQYSGVDVREVRSTDPADTDWEAERGPGPWEQWERNWMGLHDSPYRSLQWQVQLKFEVYGDRKNMANPFHWDRVEFNLPGSKGYRSDRPWIMKIRFDGHISAEIFVYEDDGRPMGYCTDLTWQAAWAYGSGCSRRGIQDASRKRTSPTESPEPWAGTVTRTEGGSLVGMVSQEKWDKTKGLLKELTNMLTNGPLPLQHMLEIRGFLMYVVRTYPWLNPYMKGMHLTIDSWQARRAEELLAFESSKWANVGLPCRRVDEEEDGGTPTPQAPEEECAPPTVEPVPRYLRDLECLVNFIGPDGSQLSLWWGTQVARGRVMPSLSSMEWTTNWGIGILSGERSLPTAGRQRI
jgi:hypothetical protein